MPDYLTYYRRQRHPGYVVGVTPPHSRYPLAADLGLANNLYFFAADDLIDTFNNGDYVSPWIDRNGVSGTNGGIVRPTFRTNILNGLPAVRFDGSSQMLLLSTQQVFGSGAWHFFSVFMTGAAVSGNYTFVSHSGTASALQIRISSSKLDVVKSGATDLGGSTTTLVTGTAYFMEATYATPNLSYYLNTVADGTRSSAQSFTTAVNNIGKNYDGYYLNVDLCELIMCTSIQTGAALANAQAYLKAKYNL